MSEDKRNVIDAWIIDKFRPFSKTWLEIARNALVVGLLIFIARKSNSGMLMLLSFFTTMVFSLYCLSYVLLSIPPYRSTAINRLVRIGLNVGSFAILSFVIWRWGNLISKTLFQLADTQVK
jgi:hypothetical protein